MSATDDTHEMKRLQTEHLPVEMAVTVDVSDLPRPKQKWVRQRAKAIGDDFATMAEAVTGEAQHVDVSLNRDVTDDSEHEGTVSVTCMVGDVEDQKQWLRQQAHCAEEHIVGLASAETVTARQA